MFIGRYSYKGFDYEVHFTNIGEWREHKNHFFAKSENGIRTDYYKDFDSCVKDFEDSVDKFLELTPKSISELVELLGEECMVWKGHEDCEFDTKKATILIEAFLKTYKGG